MFGLVLSYMKKISFKVPLLTLSLGLIQIGPDHGIFWNGKVENQEQIQSKWILPDYLLWFCFKLIWTNISSHKIKLPDGSQLDSDSDLVLPLFFNTHYYQSTYHSTTFRKILWIKNMKMTKKIFKSIVYLDESRPKFFSCSLLK